MRVLVYTIAAVVLAAVALQQAAKSSNDGTGVALRSALPTEVAAKTVLNTTPRHREWVNVPTGSAGVPTFIVYPQRSDKAPIVIMTSEKHGASDWVRAVGDQLAAEGFIAIVPDVEGGEIAKGMDAVRQYAIALPAANGKSVSLDLSRGLTPAAWPQVVSSLNKQTSNNPIFGTNPNAPEDHSAHIAMAMAQTPAANQLQGAAPAGYPRGKLSDLPAGVFTAKSTLVNSKVRKEFVDIPLGSAKLHTWVEYPDGEAKAPIVIVMQHGPGMDDWQRALADQLALQGFIAIAPDLHSGFGPNGGNYDSFVGTDEVMRAGARITPEEGMRRYKAAYEWGMKLPRANGKSATIGFCAGGGYSFRFAGEVPQVNAAVVFYGASPNSETMARIKAPVLAFYGEDDARVTAAAEPTAAAMKMLGKSFEFHVYPHATHGFLEFQDLAGNPAATTDSWGKTIAFLKQHTK
jgi:carboxymethylenebutenolidase